MPKAVSHKRDRLPLEMIPNAVWLDLWFPLNLRLSGRGLPERGMRPNVC